MRVPLAVLGVVLLLAGDARADSIFGMSFFGPDLSTYDGRTEGRAGVGYAYRDSMNASVMTPTQLADLRRVTIGLSTSFERRRSEDAFGRLTRNGIDTPTVRIGLPLLGRAGVGTGFAARRATQWTVERPFSSDPSVEERIEREGTRFVVPLQIGVRVHEKLTLGAGLGLERGTVRMRYQLDLPAANDKDPAEVREDVYRGVSPQLAVALHDLGPLSVAAHWVGSTDATVDIRQRGVALSNREDGQREDTLPGRIGVGIRLDLPGAWSAGMDFERESWSDYEGRAFVYDDQGNFDPAGATTYELRDEEEWRVAVEREAQPFGLRQTTPLRLGAYHRTWHYELGGRELKEYGVAVGTGLSLSAGWARTDFALGWSSIGDVDDNGARESMWRLTLSIAGGERWY